MLVTNDTVYPFAETYSFEDDLGIAIDLKEKKGNLESNVIFYKNKKAMGVPFALENNMGYFFGVSLFNEAEVEVRIEKSEFTFLPDGYSSYG